MPKISVVIPVFNAEKFIREALNSVVNQSFKDFECVIVNDGSTDTSLNIISEFVAIDSRFKCSSIQNSGCANIPRNIAIKNSISDLILNLDADDALDFNCLDNMYERHCKTNAEVVLQRLIGCDEGLDGEVWRLPLSGFDMTKVLNGKEACALTIGGWQIPCAGMLVKKYLFQDIPEGGLFNSDEIASRHLLFQASIVAFSDTKYFYRNNTNSITRAITPRLFERLIIDSFLEDFVISRYSQKSKTTKLMRNARFFNIIYLQAMSAKFFRKFTKTERRKIKQTIRDSYTSQNISKLKRELPNHLVLVFLSTFMLFKINAVLYAIFKSLQGKKYILK